MLSESIKVYDNIFHSFGIGDDILQSENNVTKALINVFEHSHSDLRRNFLVQHLLLEDKFAREPINFDLQVKKPLKRIFKKAFVLGISEKLPEHITFEKAQADNKGVPDAVFISNDLCMLIEVKIHDAKLSLDQIRRHEKLFQDEQSIENPIFRTWDDVLLFFKQQMEVLQGEMYSITRFLMEQFINYCTINGVGSNKSKDFYLNCFPTSIRELAKEINEYISNKFKDEIDNSRPAKSGGISYKRKGRKGFFAKLESVNHMLILCYEPSRGDLMQESFNQLNIGKKRNENAKAWTTARREAWIDLNKVSSLNSIKFFIDEAYKSRL